MTHKESWESQLSNGTKFFGISQSHRDKISIRPKRIRSWFWVLLRYRKMYDSKKFILNPTWSLRWWISSEVASKTILMGHPGSSSHVPVVRSFFKIFVLKISSKLIRTFHHNLSKLSTNCFELIKILFRIYVFFFCTFEMICRKNILFSWKLSTNYFELIKIFYFITSFFFVFSK